MAAQEQEDENKIHGKKPTFPLSSSRNYDDITKLETQNKELKFKLAQAEKELRNLRIKLEIESSLLKAKDKILQKYKDSSFRAYESLNEEVDIRDKMWKEWKTKAKELEKKEAELKTSLEQLCREVRERDEVLSFMSRGSCRIESNIGCGKWEGNGKNGDLVGKNPVDNVEEMAGVYARNDLFIQIGGPASFVAEKREIVSGFGTRKTRKRNIPCLPEEIIFNILVRLPADALYNVMRCVCRQWFKMIRDPDFTDEHLLRSNYGILFLSPNRSPSHVKHANFVEMGKSGSVIASKLRIRSPGIMPLASCKGLLLYSKTREHLVVENPITRRWLNLPPLSCLAPEGPAGMAFAASSKVFKVVHPLNDGRCEIISVGVDRRWRQLDCELLYLSIGKSLHDIPSYSAGGSVHWALENCTLTLNAETETFQLHPLPEGYEERKIFFLVMGNSFSFMTCRSKFLWELWLLEGKGTYVGWTKIGHVDLRCQRDVLERKFCPPEHEMYPIGWLKCREVVVFRISCPSQRTWKLRAERICPKYVDVQLFCLSQSLIAYDIQSGKFNSMQLDMFHSHPRSHCHFATLISPKGLAE